MMPFSVGEKLRSRFYAKVIKTESCWIWTGNKSKRGYGQLTVCNQRRQATHVAWQIERGETPELHVLHRCDNPPCVRIDHLFLGTPADNMRDKSQKNRHHNQAKTRCKRGHRFDGIVVQKSGKRFRKCLSCRREMKREKRILLGLPVRREELIIKSSY